MDHAVHAWLAVGSDDVVVEDLDPRVLVGDAAVEPPPGSDLSHRRHPPIALLAGDQRVKVDSSAAARSQLSA